MSDFDLSSKERVINLINQDNGNNPYGIVINDSDVTLGTPTVLEEGDKNTELVVSSIPNTRTVGSVTVRYNRLDLMGLKDIADIPITIEEGNVNNQAVIDQLNNVYGCNISLDELEEFSVDSIDFEGSEIILLAKEDSLAWINGIVLVVKLDQDLLSNVFVNTDLRGLSWPYIFQNVLRTVLETTNEIYSLVSVANHGVIWPYVDNQVLLMTSTFGTYRVMSLDNETLQLTDTSTKSVHTSNTVVFSDPVNNRYLQLRNSQYLSWTTYITNSALNSYTLNDKHFTSGGDGIVVKEYGTDKLLIIYDRKSGGSFKHCVIVLDRETLSLIEDRGFIDTGMNSFQCKFTAYKNLTYFIDRVVSASNSSSVKITVYDEDTHTTSFIDLPETFKTGTVNNSYIQLTNTKGNIILSFRKTVNSVTTVFVYVYKAEDDTWEEVLISNNSVIIRLHLTKINDIGAMAYKDNTLNKSFVKLIE